MISVDIVLDHYIWKKKIKNPKIYIKKKLLKLNKLKLLKNKSKNYTIFLTNNKKMKELNKKFRNKNKSTDVLSFPYSHSNHLKSDKRKKIYIGDIAISYEIINFRSKKNNFLLEFDKTWIHGLLHLIGYNHIKNKDYLKMQNIEKMIINSISQQRDLN